jgi:hypothetical protein
MAITDTHACAVSFGLATAAAVLLLILPAYSGMQDGRVTHATLLEVNGQWAIVPVILPACVAFLALVLRKQPVRVLAAILMGAFALVSFSIGLFYLPAAVAMVLAATVSPKQ